MDTDYESQAEDAADRAEALADSMAGFVEAVKGAESRDRAMQYWDAANRASWTAWEHHTAADAAAREAWHAWNHAKAHALRAEEHARRADKTAADVILAAQEWEQNK